MSAGRGHPHHAHTLPQHWGRAGGAGPAGSAHTGAHSCPHLHRYTHAQAFGPSSTSPLCPLKGSRGNRRTTVRGWEVCEAHSLTQRHGRGAGNTAPDGTPQCPRLSSRRRLRSHQRCGSAPCRAVPANNSGPRPHKPCSHQGKGQRGAGGLSGVLRSEEVRGQQRTPRLGPWTQGPLKPSGVTPTGAEEPPPAGKPAWSPAGP